MRVEFNRAALILVLLFLLSLSVNAQSWRQVGPPGGDVQSLAAVPGGTSSLFLGTSDGHVFGSHDGGEHWSLLGRVGEHHDDVIQSMVVDSRSPDTIYATSWTPSSYGGGVYRSNDAGRTWHLIGLDGRVVRAITQAPSNPDILTAAATDGVYRSDDSGRQWVRISPAGDKGLRNFDSIAVDPHDPDTIYAGTAHVPWKTTDGGRNWAPVRQGTVDNSAVMSIMVDQNDASHILASASSGIYRSSDGGISWTKFKGIPKDSRRTVHILQDANRPMTVYAATTAGLWKTFDDGANWRLITPASWNVLSMVIDHENPDRLILGTERLGIQISDNGGETYRASNEGFSHQRIADAAVDPQHPERALIALATNFEPMLETSDGGRTWNELSKGLNSGPPRHVFASPDGWFAAPGAGGLLRFDRARGSWVAVNRTQKSKAAETGSKSSLENVSSNSTQTLDSKAAGMAVSFRSKVNDMAFGDDAWYAATEDGLLVSQDRGLHWRAISLRPVQKPEAGSSGVISASIRAVRTGKGDTYVWALAAKQLEVSGDSGKTWIARPLPFEPRGQVHFLPSDENTIILAGDRGVFVSHDGGASWQQSSVSEPMIDNLTSVRNSVVVATAKGTLLRSVDAGKTWANMTGPDAEGALSALLARDAGNQLVAASATEGLFVLEMGSASSASANSSADSPAAKQ